jgi:hypothetical protein
MLAGPEHAGRVMRDAREGTRGAAARLRRRLVVVDIICDILDYMVGNCKSQSKASMKEIGG